MVSGGLSSMTDRKRHILVAFLPGYRYNVHEAESAPNELTGERKRLDAFSNRR